MGTNFYLQRRNPKTGRCKDVHICKLSFGWKPSMRGYRETYSNDYTIFSWAQWKWFLLKEVNAAVGGIIFDEYDDVVDLDSFFERIEEKQNNPKNINQTASNYSSNKYSNNYSEDYWLDDEGYGFTDREFS